MNWLGKTVRWIRSCFVAPPPSRDEQIRHLTVTLAWNSRLPVSTSLEDDGTVVFKFGEHRLVGQFNENDELRLVQPKKAASA